MENKQAELDEHGDRVTDLFDYLAHIVSLEEGEEQSKPDPLRSLQTRLQHSEGSPRKVAEEVAAIADEEEMNGSILE